jgi:mutator protein MutT
MKPHVHVTAGLIWREDGSLLITRRPEGRHLSGYWEFPGGKQESRESLEDCIAREIKEELGLEVKGVQHLLSVPHEYHAKRITLHVFNCFSTVGQPQSLDGQEMRWIHLDELAQYTFPPADRQVIQFLTLSASHSRHRKS